MTRIAPALALVGGLLLPSLAVAGFVALGKPVLSAGENVRLDTGIVNGLVVDRYTWRDSVGRPRSASLVRYGQMLGGEPRGGYAVQFTYQVWTPAVGKWRTLHLNPPEFRGDAGFGYFVSHEIWRYFDANICPDASNNCTIAAVHGEDDSPLGLQLSGTGRTVSISSTKAVHKFRLNYPHWGTTVPVADPDGSLTPSDFVLHHKYDLPVTIRWTFTSGKDYPQWKVTYDLSAAPVNTVSVDMRGPYGYLIFDKTDVQLTTLEWGDEFIFATTGGSISTGSDWTWNTANTGARYNLLVAGEYEMGLVEAIPYASSTGGSEWSGVRGLTSADGLGCPDAGWRLPCDWQWPYQSIQYEGLDASPTSAKKIAWGTAPYVGTDKTTDAIGESFFGYPKVSYKIWITFDKSGGAKTRSLAASIQ